MTSRPYLAESCWLWEGTTFDASGRGSSSDPYRLNNLLESLWNTSLQVEGLQILFRAYRALKVQAVHINHGTVQSPSSPSLSATFRFLKRSHTRSRCSAALVALTHRRQPDAQRYRAAYASAALPPSASIRASSVVLTADSVHISAQSGLKLPASHGREQPASADLVTSLLVNLSDHVRSEVNDLLQSFGARSSR